MTDVVSLAVLAVSVLLLAWQTREVARQTQLGTRIAAVSAQNELAVLLQNVHLSLLERPHLRPYLYDNQPLPTVDDERAQVLLAAEILADVIETMLENGHVLPPYGEVNLADVERYAGRVLVDSVAVREIVRDRGPGEWPRIHQILESLP